mgnify:CR=1 FL=1
MEENINLEVESNDATSEAVTTRVKTRDEFIADIASYDIDTFINDAIEVIKGQHTEYDIDDNTIENMRNVLKDADTISRIDAKRNFHKAMDEYRSIADMYDAAKSIEELQDSLKSTIDSLSNNERIASEEYIVRRAFELEVMMNANSPCPIASSILVPADEIANTAKDNVNVVDIDQLKTETKQAAELTELMKDAWSLVWQRIIHTRKATSLTGDIIEKLMADRDTLVASKKDYSDRIKNIDATMDELTSPSFKPIVHKLEVPRIVRNTYRDYLKLSDKEIEKIFTKAGFTTSMIDKFANFCMEEINFNDYVADESNLAFHDFINKSARFFAYQMAQFALKASKRTNYESIVYKMYILRILEIASCTGFESFEDRFDISEDRTERVEKRESNIRHDLFMPYMSLFIMAYKDVIVK